MIQAETIIKQAGIKVMNDIKWPFDKKSGATAFPTSLEEQYEKYKNFEHYDQYKLTLFPYWYVIFDFPEDDNWQGRNVIHVLIHDVTGEPYEVGHRQFKSAVLKDSTGKYYIKD